MVLLELLVIVIWAEILGLRRSVCAVGVKSSLDAARRVDSCGTGTQAACSTPSRGKRSGLHRRRRLVCLLSSPLNHQHPWRGHSSAQARRHRLGGHSSDRTSPAVGPRRMARRAASTTTEAREARSSSSTTSSCTALSPRRAATRAEPAAVLQQAPQRATLLFLSGRMRPPAPRSERRGSGGSSKSCATGQGLRRCVRWRRPSTNASTASPRPTRRRCGRPCPFLDGVRTGSWIVEGY